jgi:hypothetical protein
MLALGVVLLFFVWSAVSFIWYACSIKNVCAKNSVEIAGQVCTPYISEYVIFHSDTPFENDPEDVKKVQVFMNEHMHSNLQIDGTFDPDDQDIVRMFQEVYQIDILAPYDIEKPSGNVADPTITKINELVCESQLNK